MSATSEMFDEIIDLRARLEAAEKDAARYWWLRNRVGVDMDKWHGVWLPCGSSRVDANKTDSAIDAAIDAELAKEGV